MAMPGMRRKGAVLLVTCMLATTADAEVVNLYAAGSLKAALSDASRAFEAGPGKGHTVSTTFAPSGLLRQRIESEEAAHVFASANMKHPKTLAEAGKTAGDVIPFATNKLCAIVRPGLTVTTDLLLEMMLKPDVRVGTSTPKADPSGDYAFALFGKAEALKPGAKATLEEKALKLTGGPTSKKAPSRRNQYGWVMSTNQADVFLTYCTNAVLARRDVPGLLIVEVPPSLSVGANYGMVVMRGASKVAAALAAFITAPEGRTILQSYGFGPPAR